MVQWQARLPAAVAVLAVERRQRVCQDHRGCCCRRRLQCWSCPGQAEGGQGWRGQERGPGLVQGLRQPLRRRRRPLSCFQSGYLQLSLIIPAVS